MVKLVNNKGVQNQLNFKFSDEYEVQFYFLFKI